MIVDVDRLDIKLLAPHAKDEEADAMWTIFNQIV